LAKELGIPSKVLIEKCHAEGIELKNHMAAISVGLAESIREWFSAGADVTSVEVGERVDVEALRERHPKPAVAEVEPPPEPDAEAKPEQERPQRAPQRVEVDTHREGFEAEEEVRPAAVGTAVAEPEATEPEVGLAEPTEAGGVEVAPAEQTGVPVETGAGQLAAKDDLAGDGADVAAPGEPEAEEGPAAPAEPVQPAGPQVVPKPAELKGPRVLRVEAPEPERHPRPRPAVAREPGVAGPGSPETAAPRRGRGKGKRPGEEESLRGRSRSPRRHGGRSDVDARVREWRDQDLLERRERLASVTGHGLRDRRAAERRRQATSTRQPMPARREPVSITTPITLKDFSAASGVPFNVLFKKLVEHTGRMWTMNQSIDSEQAELLALELGLQLNIEQAKTAFERLRDEFEQRERPALESRPPVVAMLGHVDHGKTSLLDAIRRTRVAAGEAGGITQHIGAYRIKREGWDVTFVDTPGHEAFTAMRARGADLTDVVVLVVAADDGVMPQTVEAISHAKAAGVPIVVALNKIDIPGVDLNRVYSQLSEQGLTPSEWGGETDVIKTSATSGEGIDDLIAHLSTLSELMELRSDPTVPASGMVIEAQMLEGQGVVARVLVREGTMQPGQVIVCGPGSGRIRALLDDRGKAIKRATPGTPVTISGLDQMPAAGDRVYEVGNLVQAKEIASEVQQQRREQALETTAPKPRTLEALLKSGSEAEIPDLSVIVKADTQGSIETLKQQLTGFPTEKARLVLLHGAVGAVTEADVNLAKASGALVIGFHVIAEDRARALAEQLGVEVRLYRVIYEILDDVQKALAGLLEPEQKEEIRGQVEVRQIFNVSRVGTIAGCYVNDGIVNRNHRVRLVRDGVVVVEGAGIGSLKRFKDDAREVRAGLECGIKIDGFDDVKPGDVIQAYELVEVAQEL
jgi:translation initiation factor IF-2